jgi:hypothetical protein
VECGSAFLSLKLISAFTGKCPENPNVWAFSLLPSEGDGEQASAKRFFVIASKTQLIFTYSQVKAGVVQSSGIVSLSSVPFGQYQVKLVAEMKGHPASGFIYAKTQPQTPIKNISNTLSVSAIFNADDKTCRRICLPIPDRPLPGKCVWCGRGAQFDRCCCSFVRHGDGDVEHG